jgi:putative peptidoglycan lipid II flippase
LPELAFGIFAPGSETVARAPSALALVATGAALPIVALSGVTGAWLNAKGRFWTVGLGTLLFNCGIIGALLGWGSSRTPLAVLGCGVLAGSLLRWGVQLRRLPWRSLLDAAARAGHLRPFFLAFLAGLGATTIALLPPIVLRAMASFLGEGQLVGLYYAQKLVELPVGVVLSSLSTVALTALSTSFSKNGLPQARKEAGVYLRRASLLGFIVAIFGASMASQIVEVVFGYGRIGPEGVATIAGLFAIGVFALPFAALSLIGGNFLYATHRPRAAILPAVGGLTATAICALPAMEFGDSRYLMVAAVVGQAALALGMMARGGLLTPLAGAGGLAGEIGSWMARALLASAPLALTLWLAAAAAPAGILVQLAIGGFGLMTAGAIVLSRNARA